MRHELTIDSLSSEGEGVGSLDGLKVFVEGALPGEKVAVELTLQKKNYARAALKELLAPSPHRVEPICPIFGVCGGCQIMHLDYKHQLQVKQQRVQEALARLGHITFPVPPCIPSPSPLYYRNKIQLPIIFEKGKRTIGLYRKNSHEIVPVEKCFIQCAEGEEVYARLLPLLNLPCLRYLCIKNGQGSLVILVTDGSKPLSFMQEFGAKILAQTPLIKGVVENINPSSRNTIFSPHFRLLAGEGHLFEQIHDKTFRLSPPSFFQVNLGQTHNLISHLLNLTAGKHYSKVIDAYCGVGTYALFLAAQSTQVIGTEIVEHAIADAEHNAHLNAIPNCTFLVGKAEELLPTFAPYDLVLLNPPRKGCEATLLTQLITTRPELIYISCDPATLARDLKILLDGGYRLSSLQPFDMFPQTMHVETVAHLVPNRNAFI